jgi:hypothetical protein
MKAAEEREAALALLEPNMFQISRLYRECYLRQGRGGLMLYSESVIDGHMPAPHDYRTSEELLDLYDDPFSKQRLAKLVENYDPKTQGVLTMITSSGATWFVTVKLKQR